MTFAGRLLHDLLLSIIVKGYALRTVGTLGQATKLVSASKFGPGLPVLCEVAT